MFFITWHGIQSLRPLDALYTSTTGRSVHSVTNSGKHSVSLQLLREDCSLMFPRRAKERDNIR